MRAAAIVAAIAAAVYLPILSHGFVNWDDWDYVLRNPRLKELSWENLLWMATSTDLFTYQPLCWALYALVGPENPAAVHAASLVGHSLNAGLTLALARALGLRERPAMLAAALFALHPLQVETVAWASSLCNVWATAFVLAAALLHLKGAPPAAVAAAMAAGGLFRWHAMLVPVLLFVIDRWIKRTAPSRKAYALYGALLIAIAALNFRSKQLSGAHGAPSVYGTLAEMTALLQRWLLPWELKLVYSPSDLPGPWLVAAALAAALAAAYKSSAARAALAFFAAAALPPLAFPLEGAVMFHDRYAYLAALGLPMLAAGWRGGKLAPLLLAFALLCAAKTVRQLPRWRDSISLWTCVLSRDPDASYAKSRLGVALLDEGREREAISVFLQQSARDPQAARGNLASAYNNLAVTLARSGRKTEARALLTASLKLREDVNTRRNLELLGP